VVYRCNPNLRYEGVLIAQQVFLSYSKTHISVKCLVAILDSNISFKFQFVRWCEKSGILVNWRPTLAAKESVTMFIFICKLPMSAAKCLPIYLKLQNRQSVRVRDPPWQLTVVYRCKPILRYKGIPITQQVILRSSRHIFFSEMLWQYFLVCVACFTACITLLIFLFQAKSAETTERVYHPFFRDEQRKPKIRASTYRRLLKI